MSAILLYFREVGVSNWKTCLPDMPMPAGRGPIRCLHMLENVEQPSLALPAARHPSNLAGTID